MIKKTVFTALLALGFLACDEVTEQQQLPVWGNPQIKERVVNGETVYDTIPHTVGYFRLVNQDSTIITPELLAGKIYVADFFFTSCISICPTMSMQMKRVYDRFESRDSVAIVSFSIDPEYDNVEVLSEYAGRLGATSDTWHFLTGDKDEIYDLAFNSYMTQRPADDPADANNILHSGAFILIDTQKRIRGVYDGTIAEQVDLLMKDIDRLLKEEHANTL
ncbi:MAG: SCO family protein [Bacteroidota bacterium]